MIKFQRRSLNCWNVCEDIIDRNKYDIPLLEFETKEELFDYIHTTLPFTTNEKDYKLRINEAGDAVVHWSVLGFIK
jgi:hypothetical protein